MERTIRRGDIYYAELNPVVGSEQGGTRPVLIISNNIGNRHRPAVMIAVITSRVQTNFFEDENINTLTMDSELLLVVLSSIAQQEVENISSNVKKGLKMKMQRGELVGFQGCLGYDYHKDTKSISVNEKEAEIVRYIFNRYIEGAGCTVIGNELENLGYKTKYGSSKLVQSTVIGIIKNEKYKGDLLLGKTFTVDPISKRWLENFGEKDKFYICDHHEPIISEEIGSASPPQKTGKSIARIVRESLMTILL